MSIKRDITLLKKQYQIPIMCKLYTLLVALLPIFSTYASGIPGLSLADLLLVFFTSYSVLQPQVRTNNYYRINILLILGPLYLIVLFDLVAAMDNEIAVYDIVIRTVRYFFYVLCFLFTSKRLLCVDLLKRYVKIVSILATVYILLQYVLFYVLNFVLIGYLPFLPLYTVEYASKDYMSLYTLQMFRPTSFFLEPAHFSRYAVIGVVLYIWGESVKTEDIYKALFISLGIMISTSAQGYVLIGSVWLMFMLIRSRKIKNPQVRKILQIFVLLAPIAFVIIGNLPFVKDTINRVLGGSITNTDSAVGGRLAGFTSFDELSLFHKLFGMGFGSIPKDVWLSSAAYWLYGSGGIIFVIFTISMIYIIYKLKGENKVIFIIFFLLFFSDDSTYNYMCILFYSITMLANGARRYEKDLIYSA